MRNDSRPGGWSVLLVVLLVAAAVLLLGALRIRVFDPWLNANFPHLYPGLLAVILVLFAVKMTFDPSSWDFSGGFRWLWVPLMLMLAVVFLARALG